jgi:hypothetical protein
MEEIYLDNHSATRPHTCVVDQMASFLKNYWAASSSPHRLGEQSQLPLVTSINKLYDLSTFASIIENVSNLVSNIDFQYKKIAVIYPQYITRDIITVLLLVKSKKSSSKIIKIIEEAQVLFPENIYKIIETEDYKKIDCKELLNRNITIEVKKTPELFLIINDKIIEVPISSSTDINFLKKFLKK